MLVFISPSFLNEFIKRVDCIKVGIKQKSKTFSKKITGFHKIWIFQVKKLVETFKSRKEIQDAKHNKVCQQNDETLISQKQYKTKKKDRRCKHNRYHNRYQLSLT